MSTRVFIVDDSPTSRLALRRALEGDPRIVIIGEAADGDEALRRIPLLAPDVVLMDIVMPGLDGLAVTEELMATCPRPVLVISDQVGTNANLSFEALRMGALDVIGKPSARDLADERTVNGLRRKVRLLAEVPVITRRRSQRRAALSAVKTASRPSPDQVAQVCIGASTGGPPALQRILASLKEPPRWPVLVVQHMTPGFTAGMVGWLRAVTGHDVALAEDGTALDPGRVYVAGDGSHLHSDGRRVRLSTAPPRAGHRPSVDVLFEAVADSPVADRTVAVLLTGMGRDGAAGLGRLRRHGAWTLAQDEASSVVYGMPRAAAEEEAASEVLSLDEITSCLASLA